ncbi:ABC transporter ATP-binding protein [Peribacillus cavernae]|uniref:Quaternary amine transport ATP-binding protein n=1 Tax=Peribacillus cavernae TaxID=1674310 RepID=A0A3S0VMP3_9BACI|nr:ABC transporter ATP-binding protein [Peribacillus cavernae]MDQ0217999.1 osmoprotectant transport system ATP-binding protein [Peribacillus cavernae]RUQ28953.1 ABC transporter ATP-binding protein [Peribacillus cavernae]
MIKFDHVTKSYEGGINAVKDVNFTVEKGNIVVLLGPSGCGKTTLLRMVNRLESITKGTINVNGQNSMELNEIDLRKKIGYVIQSNGLFPNMTIEDNVMIVPDLLGWSKKEKRERFYSLMGLIGLNADDYRKRYPNELSGGQQQRIGVARALAADPPVMLMDEPFGALDPIIREKIQDEFLHIQREVKKTILFVSHDIDEAIKMADKIVLMRGGEIMQFDTPSEMLAHPKNDFVSQFFGKDRAIKSLSLHTVKKLQDIIGLVEFDETIQDTKTINVNQDLRNTLSMLMNQEADQVIVTDDNGRQLGAITIDLVQKYLHFEIKGKPSVAQKG